jgi:protein LSM14
MLDVRKLEEYDFEKANAEFVELTKDIEDLKISDDKKDKVVDEKAHDSKNETAGDTVTETYNKTKSFFDTISCEALERAKG